MVDDLQASLRVEAGAELTERNEVLIWLPNSKAWECRHCHTVFDSPSYYSEQEWDRVGEGCDICLPLMDEEGLDWEEDDA